MAEVINEVVETNDVDSVMVAGPTIFKTSKSTKIVFGVVTGIAAAYGICKGIRCVLKKRAAKEEATFDTTEVEVEEASFTEVDEEE